MVLRQTAIRLALFVGIIHQISAYPAIQGHSNKLQSLSASSDIPKPAPDMVATIDQVHKILQDDPSLPRLTRGEIEELFEQVTKEEYEKSLKTGDVDRANNMRALMLVLPYNTNNTTEDNLQELYTRPPITKVIDSYSLPQPQKFQTPSSVPTGKVEIVEIGNLAATTYKPSFRLKEKTNPSPTTYHPTQALPKMHQLTTVQLPVQVPITSLPLLPDIEVEQDKGTRYSSSYNANKPDWTLLEGEFNRPNNHYEKFTPMPDLSGVLQSMGMGFQNMATKKFKLEDYYQVNKPALSSTIKQSNPYPGTIDVADFMRTLPPRPNLEAYSEFQPLNIGEEIRIQPEVEHYLNRFGIVNRKRKQIKPEDFLETTTSKDANHLTEITKEEQPIKRIDTNVNDSDTNNVQDQEDLVQLKKLLNNLRELERLNVSLTDDMLKSIDLSNYNLSSNIRAQGPDPVISVSDTQKNDIKRQSETESTSEPTKFNLDLDLDETKEDSDNDSDTDSDNDSATTTTTTTTTTTEEPTTTTEESRNGSLSDLEGSFGGTDPVTEDPELPPPKQNGFYFLADWNSFLEVGEAGNDQVVVRFDPKIGDPRRFLKISVP